MPILSIKALPQAEPSKIEPALKKACAAIAEAYRCKPEQVWATWEELPPGRYVEGSHSEAKQPSDSHPPIAQLTCFEGKTDAEIENILLVAASALSEALGIGDNIFISYHEAFSGRVVAGNGIIRRK